MIDVEMVDALFDQAQETGVEWRWSIFDKRVLLPLGCLAEAVKNETEHVVSVEQLQGFADDQWFPLLPGAGDTGGELGVPLYVPSRVGLLLDLARDGYAKQELRCVASYEESLIDEVLTTDESRYIDDDLETLIVYTQGLIDGFIHGQTIDAHGNVVDRSEERAVQERNLASFRKYQTSGIPAQRQVAVAKYANRVRAFSDAVRVFMLNEERAKIRTGYSPTVILRSHSWACGDEKFQAGSIMWEATIRCALAHLSAGETCRIRVPGFILEGDRILTLQTYTPKDYSVIWKELDLEAYLLAWSTLNSERRCLHCLAMLSGESDHRKRYCDERCRNAAKQKRFREQNPDAVFRSQKKYWESVH